MREIVTHHVPGLNEVITIQVLDEPGQSGACHEYLIETVGRAVKRTCCIHFQNGPLQECGVNGISNEALLAIVRDRLECFQAGAYACDTNQHVLDAICVAMEALASRTRERLARNVEGTNQP